MVPAHHSQGPALPDPGLGLGLGLGGPREWRTVGVADRNHKNIQTYMNSYKAHNKTLTIGFRSGSPTAHWSYGPIVLHVGLLGHRTNGWLSA